MELFSDSFEINNSETSKFLTSTIKRLLLQSPLHFNRNVIVLPL